MANFCSDGKQLISWSLRWRQSVVLLQIPSPALKQSLKRKKELQVTWRSVSQSGALQKTVSGLANIKDAIWNLISKCISSYGGEGYAAIQEHFDELWGAISKLAMLEVTTKAYWKGFITSEVKDTIFSVNGTSVGVKADTLLSAIQEQIKTELLRNKLKLTQVLLTLLLKSSDQSQRMDNWRISWQVNLCDPY